MALDSDHDLRTAIAIDYSRNGRRPTCEFYISIFNVTNPTLKLHDVLFANAEYVIVTDRRYNGGYGF